MTESITIKVTGTPTGSLKYPAQLKEGQTDYVVFQHMEYRTNKSYDSQEQHILENASPPPTGNVITLYMPNSTPQIGNAQDWNAQGFGGEYGERAVDIGMAIAGGLSNAKLPGLGDGPGLAEAGQAVARQIREIWDGGEIGAIRQMGLDAVGRATAGSANNLLAMQRGEIYNPNVELLYQTPKLRNFNFNFNFLPKSAAESQIVNKIIKEFKVWSAPEAAGSMYKVPHIWEVFYMSGGTTNKNMNRFKKAALTGVTVKANSNQDMHMSFPDGMPVSTALSLSFMEVDFITREDQENSDTHQGY